MHTNRQSSVGKHTAGFTFVDSSLKFRHVFLLVHNVCKMCVCEMEMPAACNITHLFWWMDIWVMAADV